MQNHTQVLTGLEMEFKRMDRLCALGELHAFGTNCTLMENIKWEELKRARDVIRSRYGKDL